MIRDCIRATESKRYRKLVSHRNRFDNTGYGPIYKLEMVRFCKLDMDRIYKLEMGPVYKTGNGYSGSINWNRSGLTSPRVYGKVAM